MHPKTAASLSKAIAVQSLGRDRDCSTVRENESHPLKLWKTRFVGAAQKNNAQVFFVFCVAVPALTLFALYVVITAVCLGLSTQISLSL